MATRPEDLIYAIDERPPLPMLLVLGLQQVCTIAVYLIIILIIARAAQVSSVVTQSMISWSMIAIAIAALLQALWKGPVGSGYLVPSATSAIYLQASILAVKLGGLPLVFGSTILAGLFESLISRTFNILRTFFPPIISGLIIIAISFELGIIGMEQVLGIQGETRYEIKQIAICIFTLFLMMGLTIWGKGSIRLTSSLIGLAFGWLIAFAVGLIPSEQLQIVSESPWFGFPHINYIGYSFDARLLITFCIAGLAAALRTIGVLITCQQINDANWKRPNKLEIQKGILADGLGCMIAGALGSSGITTSPSAVGVSKFTFATSRYIALAFAGWLLVLSCLPKVIAIFTIIPPAIMGSALLYAGSILLVSGLEIIISQPINVRKTFIIGISIFLGLSHKIFPDFYQQLPNWMIPFTGTLLTLTTLTALILNFLFRIKARQSVQLTIEVGQDMKRIDEVIRTHTKKWGGATAIVENAIEFLNVLYKELIDNGYTNGPIQATISYDEVLLKISLLYPGKFFHLPPLKARLAEGPLTEETAISAGLSSYLSSVYPDRTFSSYQEGMCEVRFAFELF